MTSPVETAIRSVVTKGVLSLAEFNRKHRKAKAPNPYLNGIHKPLDTETTIVDLKVTGDIPAALKGLYVRNGPNPADKPNPATHHWFLGDGMLHGLRLEGGEAKWYRNRWVRSTKVSTILGEAPAPGPRAATGADAVNTNVIGHAGKIWAIVEAGGMPVEVSEELETRTHTDLDGTLEKALSAHPHLDPDTGELHAICYYAQTADTIWHLVIDTDGRVRRNEPIAVEHGPSIHDCMITENYVVVMDLPVTFSMMALIMGDTFPYRWNPRHAARIGLLPREGKGDEIIWCDVDPCYIFHPANAYETEDGKVVMDACVHSRMFAPGAVGPDAPACAFEHLEIDPASQRVTRTVLDASPQDFPRPDERLTGKPYRYAYCVALPEGGSSAFMGDSRIFKHDLAEGTRQTRDFGAGKLPGEFVFIPAHDTSEEDEGWLMGLVVDTANETTDLVILNAQDFTGPQVAAITIPQRIPPGFHGNWIPM